MPLPERPNLRHLKAQAQDLIAAGRAATVAEAQFQVARGYGFASWPKLKSHVEAVGEREPEVEAPLTPDALIDTIITFLTGQDRLTLDEVRGALRRELEAAGPAALLALHERLVSAPDWDFYPADPIARQVHHLLADRLIDPDSGIDGIAHAGEIAGRRVVIFANHLSYADANLIDTLLRRAGGQDLADRLTAIAGPKVYSSRKRRFSSLCFGTIRTPQSSGLSTEEAAMPRREVAQAARRSIELAHERLRHGDALLVFAEGTRSRTREMQRLLSGAARYLEVEDTWILPVGVTGTEALFPVDAEELHRVSVRVHLGAPIPAATLRADAQGDRQSMMDAVGASIAALLPQAYRGVYG
ncbi:MAG: lysophospholipid acyltransferase family protein [Vicinamibacterales bacterium]